MNKPSEKKLNKEQLSAIRHKKGPILIIAGAGTGKTTVICERIKFLIEKDLARPSEILALTFTEKAAREMEERVDVALPYGYTQMWISTFHSFCDRVLRAEALHIGLNPRFKLMRESETIQLIRNNLFKFKLKYFRPLGNPTKFIGGMLQHFGRLQDENLSPKQYSRWAKTKHSKPKTKDKEERIESEKWLELAGAYKTYEELKIKEEVFDFGDLIVKTLKLFQDRPNILKNYRKQFKYILVDEFQDTNVAQNDLVMLLVGRGGNITVVADDDQSIYKWRGAAISNVLQFRKNYPRAKLVTLTKNYRSRQEILDKAYDLIQHNNPDRLESVENIDKKLVAQRRDPSTRSSRSGRVRFIHSDRVENEADAVAKEIKRLIDNGLQTSAKVGSQKSDVSQYRDIAILVRANNHAEPFLRSLQRHNIPCQFLGPGRLFKQPEIIDMVSYLRILYDFDDSISFYRVLSIDYFDISPQDLIKLSNHARKNDLSIFEVSSMIDKISVSKDTKKKIKKLIEIIKGQFKLVKEESAGQLLYNFLEQTGLLQELVGGESIDAERKAKNVSKLFDKLKTYEVDHEDAGIAAVCSWLELSSELGESPLAMDTDWTEVDAVNLLTIHSAKGLEFLVVFLVNLVGQRFPTNQRREQIPIPEELIKEVLPTGDFHLQEERRLFYVGMTRARDLLYFTAADYYGEGKREKKLSPFIFEALGDEATSSELPKDDSQQLSFMDFQTQTNDLSKSEVRSPKSDIHIDYLSYSQIQTFQICPLHYKLRYILKIPTPASAALSFGISIHETMKDFYLSAKAGIKPTRKFVSNILKDNWMLEGYASKTYEKKMFNRGKKYLENYLKKEFDSSRLPVAIEQSFVIPLYRSLKSEDRRPLKIGGKFDRVDKVTKGIEIVDYKTGERVPDQKQVDRDLQLTFYALAAAKLSEPPFDKKPKDIKLSLYYFAEQKKISTIRTKEQLKQAEKEIYEWREKIENSDFKCSGHIFCRNCEYGLFCRSD